MKTLTKTLNLDLQDNFILKTIIDRLIELSNDEKYVNNMSMDELQSTIEAITDISEGNPTYDLAAENERS